MFEKAPNIFPAEALMEVKPWPQAEIAGKWVPARPIGFFSIWHRIRCAYLALTGKCDLLRWPGGQ